MSHASATAQTGNLKASGKLIREIELLSEVHASRAKRFQGASTKTEIVCEQLALKIQGTFNLSRHVLQAHPSVSLREVHFFDSCLFTDAFRLWTLSAFGDLGKVEDSASAYP